MRRRRCIFRRFQVVHVPQWWPRLFRCEYLSNNDFYSIAQLRVRIASSMIVRVWYSVFFFPLCLYHCCNIYHLHSSKYDDNKAESEFNKKLEINNNKKSSWLGAYASHLGDKYIFWELGAVTNPGNFRPLFGSEFANDVAPYMPFLRFPC